MRRREILLALVGAAVACPAAARAQSGERRLKLRVGWLAVASNPFIEFFRQGMAELGHREGGDFLIRSGTRTAGWSFCPRSRPSW